MNVKELKKYIVEKPDRIVKLLEAAEFCNISDLGDEFRCAKDEVSNPTSVAVNKSTLVSSIFSEGIHGDIFNVLQHQLSMNSFKDVIQFTKGVLGLSGVSFKSKKTKLPFGGYYKSIANKDYDYNDQNYDIHNLEVLDRYMIMPSLMFIEDNISIATQNKYKIGYDSWTGRIVIPQVDIYGNTIGATGRYNAYDVPDGVPKYLALTKGIPRSKLLFGFHNNKKYIQESDVLFLGEGAKFVMQLDSMGLYNGLSVGKNSVSKFQARAIKSLKSKCIIVCYDEGLSEESIRKEAEKLRIDTLFFKNKVGYVYDRDNKFLKKGSKDSPSDNGIDVFKGLIKECVVWL